MHRIRRGLETWGHYLLAALCAAVILLSALWTRDQQALAPPGSQALSDQSQRLSDVTPPPSSPALLRPVDGPVAIPYSEAPVVDARTGVWQAHPWVAFSADNGGAVRAMLPGTILAAAEEVVMDHGNSLLSRYRGLQSPFVRPGQTVQAGDLLGTAAGETVSVWLLQNGVSLPFGVEWLDNSPKQSYNN